MARYLIEVEVDEVLLREAVADVEEDVSCVAVSKLIDREMGWLMNSGIEATCIYGPESVNTNCLQGMLCPACLSPEPFEIRAITEAVVYDSGVEDNQGFEWDDESICVCKTCGFGGRVRDFRLGNHKRRSA